ncbi:signal transduction histidine kinase [Methylopila jiangsuensis]|uniref:Signal transduction histidine kinase n=1 Tax=Methylopila jiangsuensis TaxID=586230 RepID=A0A9W6N221_9HYPH|nr:PAS domain-containing protein [Methylopila jiangsuensis]MDR6287271.1 PAS domain S-box-containing protein [Methylopila jiangsuensis]GLK74770.1 signal transduction histidine kinase [Methylopila jiangsuensis]
MTHFPAPDPATPQPASLFAAATASLALTPEDFGPIARCDIPMCVADAGGDMPIVFANPAFLALSGYDERDVIGRNCRFLQGPSTEPEAAERFRRGFADGRPFQVALLNHRKDGAPFRNEVFIAPIRDAGGAIVRFIGMQVSSRTLETEAASLAALRHHFRNQLQTMTSFVSLLGQRMEPGDGRDAFEDVRVRFESMAAAQSEAPADASETVRADAILARVVEGALRIYDPNRRHPVAIDAAPLPASGRRATLLAQALTEIMIDLARNAMSTGPGAHVSVTVAALPDGGCRLAAACAAPGREPVSGSTELGLAIAQSLARSAGGEFRRRIGERYEIEILLPAETDLR